MWEIPPSTQNAAKIAGDFVLSANEEDIYFHGLDGYMQHFFWNAATNKWDHDGLVPSWWTQDVNFKVSGKIILSPSGNTVFYKGADSRMQHYYWSGSAWVHAYIDGWVPPSSTQNAAKIAGDFVLSANEQDIYFHGLDGYMQHFFWNAATNKWDHDGLVPSWWTQDVNFKVSGKIILSPSGNIVFYKGADARMQHYYWDYPCEYFASGNVGIPNNDESFENNNIVEEGNDSNIHSLLLTYPNPSNKQLNIKFRVTHDNTNVLIILSDIFGKEIPIIANKSFDSGVYIELFQTDGFSNGVYIVRYISDQKTNLTSKIIIHNN